MEKRTLSVGELKNHLNEQIGALQRSVLLYDEGYQLEAKRISVILRVMLHSGKDPSLLKRLGLDDMDVVDSAPQFDPQDLMPFHGLVSLVIEKGEVFYNARLDNQSPDVMTPFVNWWNATVFSDKQNRQMSRKDVVLTAANQDGGAHVDGALRADYAALRYENSLGWLTGQESPPSNDPGYAAIRQIAHEILKTLIPGYSKTKEDVRTTRKRSEISGGKIRFFPHENAFFANQTAAPIVPSQMYFAEIIVDSITTGSVRMVVNSAATEPLNSAGTHSMLILAGSEPNSGVFGEYTDAIIDRVSIRQMLK
jgi:hypothetical protein